MNQFDKIITEKQFDEERALYHLQNGRVSKCIFAGPADGESVLKESRNIAVEECSFSLRYPLWHVKGFSLKDSTMDELTRAALWYADDGEITGSRLHGIKAVRECNRILLTDCDIDSQEFGWKCSDITIKDCTVNSEYIFFDSKNVMLSNIKMTGKYSFQYMENLVIENCTLDTKDAFWHSRNVTVKNSVVKGEYPGWFSDGLTLIDCKIIGTQPLCYCENLKLINCTMEETDLSFEYSDVEADIIGNVMSVKNPKSGRIVLDSVDEVIMEDAAIECSGEVIVRIGGRRSGREEALAKL
ncbi:MAG: DUF3737 family protein [Blautia sp.]|nr:DUF3737 family protein [Blautia sp.]MCM1201959.1 DUF3737 family protein [Bacteroides fragilis]